MSISSSLIRSVLIEKVIEDFRSLYEERFGKCFRTEIRDTGIFICGIHQSRIWENSEDQCPELEELAELIGIAFDNSVDRSVAVPKPNPAPAIPPTKTNPFDGTRWPNSVPPKAQLNPDQSPPKSIREATQEFDLWGPTRDSYNVPI